MNREKERVRQIYHRDTHYYIIISRNTSVPMIGHLELATGTLTCHMLAKISPGSQIFLTRLGADLDSIVNAERFARIDQIDRIFDYERNHCFRLDLGLGIY